MSTKLGGIIDGVKIEIYSGNDHNPPHAHIKYGEYEVRCTLEIPLELLDPSGGFPRTKLRIALEYISDNQKRLLKNFMNANPKLRKKK